MFIGPRQILIKTEILLHFARGVNGAFEIKLVSIGISYGGYPEAVTLKWILRIYTTRRNFLMISYSIIAEDAYGNTFTPSLTELARIYTFRGEFLQHQSRLAILQSAPFNSALIRPVLCYAKTQAVFIKGQASFHIADSQQRHNIIKAHSWGGKKGEN